MLNGLTIEGHAIEDEFYWEALLNVVLASPKAVDEAYLGALDQRGAHRFYACCTSSS